MTSELFPLALNELLGFVHRSLSAFPERSFSILSFTAPSAGWRFNIFAGGRGLKTVIKILRKIHAGLQGEKNIPAQGNVSTPSRYDPAR